MKIVYADPQLARINVKIGRVKKEIRKAIDQLEDQRRTESERRTPRIRYEKIVTPPGSALSALRHRGLSAASAYLA